MNCRDIDLIQYLDGTADEEIRIHIENCRECFEEFEKMTNFTLIITGQYAEGKKLENDLNGQLKSIDLKKMKKMPHGVAIKVAEMKKKSLSSRLKKVVGENNKKVSEFLENIMSPQMQFMPASPKDITKTKQKNKKKKKIPD